MLYALSMKQSDGVVYDLLGLIGGLLSFFQIITTFSVVDNIKQQFYAQQGRISRFCIFFLDNFMGLLY